MGGSSGGGGGGDRRPRKLKVAVSLEILVRTSLEKQLDPSPGPIASR